MTSVATQLAIAAKTTAIVQRNDPDEVRDREDQPEEDGEAAPLQVVLDDELDRMLVHACESMTHPADVRLSRDDGDRQGNG